MNIQNVQYQMIYNILKNNEDTLLFDFQGVNFLNTFEIVELFALATQHSPHYKKYQIINKTDVVGYLKRINFFSLFEQVNNVSTYTTDNIYTGGSTGLIELHKYDRKEQFYGDYDKIFTMLEEIGLTIETASLVASSLGEIVDNAFLHNLGKWPLDINIRSVLLAQNFPNKRELCFSYCDFGVGFKNTLLHNYPYLKNNFEAIKLALEKNVTSRSPQRGGNGLTYLQQNIFNGFQGELLLRSGEALVTVSQKDNIVLSDNNVQINQGTNIFFSLKY